MPLLGIPTRSRRYHARGMQVCLGKCVPSRNAHLASSWCHQIRSVQIILSRDPNLNPDLSHASTRTFTGNVTFDYVLSDGVNPATANGTVALIVKAPLPVAAPDVYACPRNAACVVSAAAGLLANDFSENSANLEVLLVGTTPPAEGALALQSNGAFTFTPNA